MEPTDEALARGAASGNEDDFRALVRRYDRLVWRLALRLIPNVADVEEVVQDTFVRVWRGLPAFQSGSTFRTWLMRIASNRVTDFMRLRGRKDVPTVSLDGVRSHAPDPERLVWFSEVQKRLFETMREELSEMEQKAFTLRHFEGMSNAEISGELGVPEAAARQAIRRAMDKLRDVLKPVVR